MLSHLNKYHIILASASPRRRQLLSGLGIDFEVRTLAGIDESYPDDSCPMEGGYKTSFERFVIESLRSV